MKTLAIRLEDDQHAQLVALTQLQGTSLVDEIRDAISEHMGRKSADGSLAAQAQAALEEIDRDALTRRQAIEALLGQPGATAGAAPRRSRQTASGSES